MLKSSKEIRKLKEKGALVASDRCTISGDDSSRPFLRRNIKTYVAPKDLPVEFSPFVLESTSTPYVPFLDFCNGLLNEITSIINTSPTCAAIIAQKTAMGVGDGLVIIEGTNNNILSSMRKMREPAKLNEKDLASLNDFLHNVNAEGETITDVLTKIFADFWSYGNVYIELIKSEVSTGGETAKSFTIRHVPLSWCRPRKVEGKQAAVTHIGISNEFLEGQLEPNDVVDIPVFPVFAQINDEGGERSIIHIKSYSPGFFYWGLPDWIAASLWGEIEYRGAKYNQSKFANGFAPSALITLFASMNNKEGQEWIDNIVDSFTNTGNNAKIIASVLRDTEAKMDVQLLTDKNEGNYMELSQLAREQIITAHRWSPALVGKSTAGTLGSNQQIRSEREIVQNDVINPIQNLIITKFLNPVIAEAAIFLEEKGWENISFDIVPTMPISFIGDLEPAEVLTRDEQRAAFGLEPLEDEFSEDLDNPSDSSTDTKTTEDASNSN